MQPVLFFAYANSQSKPLPSLSREDDTIYSILVNRHLKGHYAIHRDSFTSLEKINAYLGKFQDQIVLFHYSGHADTGRLLLTDQTANAKGIAHQLGTSAIEGKLQIVILNGCSTYGQVNALLEAGVPVVIATSAPVEDNSATEFAIRFYKGLDTANKSILDAFEDALGPAQTATEIDLRLADIPRGLGVPPEEQNAHSMWGLYVQEGREDILQTNPLPRKRVINQKSDFEPNELLNTSLFDTLLAAKCEDIEELHEKEKKIGYVELDKKQMAIISVLPSPIVTHLQKLLCPTDTENEGYDKISHARLQRIGTLFHATTELLTYIMLSQLWEAQLKGEFRDMPNNLKTQLQQHFNWTAKARAIQEHIPIIQSIRVFLDSLRPDEQSYPYFIEELQNLKELYAADTTFAKACAYLANFRQQTLAGKIDDADVPDLCEEAERQLCHFFQELGFLHRYALTSIQNIDIRKYRHQRKALFRHELVKLMRAFGKGEQIYYDLDEYLDNRGVAIVKGKVTKKDGEKLFTSDDLDYLNLSPFLIDQNAFEANTDLSNLLSFEEFRKNNETFTYHSVKRPESRKDQLDIVQEGPYAAVFEQLQAYQLDILGIPENPNGHG